MNKHLLATFITISTIPFFSIAHIQPRNGQPNKAQLLQHLKNVKIVLQKHLRTLHNRLEEFLMCRITGLPEEAEEQADMIFFFELNQDFYNNSTFLQQKLAERVTPTFNFICNNIKPLTIDEMSLNFSSHKKSTFDKNTTIQLRMLFQSLYFKHHETYRNNNSNSNSELSQMSTDELFEYCLQFIMYSNELFVYESRALLQKLDAKIKELSL